MERASQQSQEGKTLIAHITALRSKRRQNPHGTETHRDLRTAKSTADIPRVELLSPLTVGLNHSVGNLPRNHIMISGMHTFLLKKAIKIAPLEIQVETLLLFSGHCVK